MAARRLGAAHRRGHGPAIRRPVWALYPRQIGTGGAPCAHCRQIAGPRGAAVLALAGRGFPIRQISTGKTDILPEDIVEIAAAFRVMPRPTGPVGQPPTAPPGRALPPIRGGARAHDAPPAPTPRST